MRMWRVGTVIVVEEARREIDTRNYSDRPDIVLSIMASDAEHLPFLSVSDAMSDGSRWSITPEPWSASLRSMTSSTFWPKSLVR